MLINFIKNKYNFTYFICFVIYIINILYYICFVILFSAVNDGPIDTYQLKSLDGQLGNDNHCLMEGGGGVG